MAAILITAAGAAGDAHYKCGSTLIHPSVVLTVAHCVHRTPAARLLVRVGQRDIVPSAQSPPVVRRDAAQDRRVRRVSVHQHFNASRYSLHNDVALLFLDAPVQLSAGGVRSVCLAPSAVHTFDRRRCVVSGWGAPATATTTASVGRRVGAQRVQREREREQRRTRTLKKIVVPVVGRTVCERSLRTTRLGRRYRLHRSFMCAGGEPGRDACTGDGGSPLMCAVQSSLAAGGVRYVQAGIVALGIGCGTGVPGVYVNVAEMRAWIDEQMLANGYARTFYQT